MKTVYISIGNSDHKLSQVEWSHFYSNVDFLLRKYPRHGAWVSPATSEYQNACWCIEVYEGAVEEELRKKLRLLARQSHQDSIAWAEAKTEFLSG